MASLNKIGAPAPQTNTRPLNDPLLQAQRRHPLHALSDRHDTAASVPADASSRSSRSDTVELSSAALAAHRAADPADLPPERAAEIARVRSLIAQDSYLSDEVLAIALDRLIDDALGLPR